MSKAFGWMSGMMICGLGIALAGSGCSSDDDDDLVGTSSSSGAAVTSSSGGSSSGAATSSSGGGTSSSSGGTTSSSSSSGSVADGGSDGGNSDCTAITLDAFTLGDNEDNFAIFQATFAPQLISEDETIALELSGAGTPGTYDLSQELQHQTCDHCFLIDSTTDDGDTYFFQSSGTFTLTALSFDDGTVQGTLTNAKLIEVTVAEDATSTPVPNGRCVTIASATINVTSD